MPRGFRGIWIGLVAPGVLAAAAAAEPSGPSDADLAGCVRLLGDPNFETRERAFQRLLEWGLEHPDRVLETLPQSHEDIEIQNRCQEIRDRIPWERRYRKVAALAGGHADLVAAARNCFPFLTDQSLGALMEAAGNRQRELAGMLLVLLEGERDPNLQAALISNLGGLEVREVSRKLLPYLRNRHPIVRHQAAYALGRLDEPGISREILAFLDEDDPAVRQVAVIALGQLKDRSTTEPILRLLEAEDNPQVRQSAAHAVIQIEEGNSPEILKRFLDDPSIMVRQLALAQIARLRDRSLLPLVEKSLQDDESSVRAAAIQAISVMGGPQDALLLAPFLKDPDPMLRTQGVHALSRLRDFSWAPRIAELLDDPNQGVRRAAAHALASLCNWRLGELGLDPAVEAKRRWAERQAPDRTE